MKVLFWVPYPTEGASNRYRVEQYFPYLKRAGITYCLRPFWNSRAFEILYKKGHHFKKFSFFLLGTFSRILDLLNISRYDVVFIHREAFPLGSPILEALLSILGKPLIFDFDDAIFLPSTSKPNSFIEAFKNPVKVTDIISRSRYVIAGNRYLAEFAQHYNNSVSVIPTPIDTEKYYPSISRNNKEIVIGWMGSVTTIGFLGDILNKVFGVLSKRFENIIFEIVGCDCSQYRIKNVVSKAWTLKDEIDDLRNFDIGIMPMPDNEWTKGKCGFKAILYMSMGIPCVCSPVGVNKEIIIDGLNGFLADTEEEWIEKLSLLIENRELRRKLGSMGRETVESRYSVKINAPKILDIIQRVFEERNAK